MTDYVNDAGSRRYAEELESLHVLLRDYPMESPMAWVQLMVDVAGTAMVEVQLAARWLPAVASGLIEWKRTLVRITGAVWRLDDGDSARVVVSGATDVADTLVLVVGGPVPYGQLVGVQAEVGEKVIFDTDQLYLWAIDLPGGTS